MLDNKFSCGTNTSREHVIIETNKVLDSCKDRDCYENTRVFLTNCGKEIIQRTSAVRVKSSCISSPYIDIEPVQFNRGFYSLTIRFFIKIVFEACIRPGHAQEFDGIAVVEKRVILYGGESNVNVFKSKGDGSGFCSIPEPCCGEKNNPTAVVEIVDPIILGIKIFKTPEDCCKCCCCASDIPEEITTSLADILSYDDCEDDRYLTVSLGIFSIVRLTRPAQYLINAAEYNIPDKECISPNNDDPCGIFRAMAFPSSEFSTSSYVPQNDKPIKGKCGCGDY